MTVIELANFPRPQGGRRLARIRSVKPEFFRSRKLSERSLRARLTFIGLWTACDDEGRYKYEPELLKADLWPFEDDVTAKDVDADVHELATALLVCEYEVAGRRYLHVINWHEHQAINRPSKSRIPECSREDHGPFTEPSSPRARAQDLGSRNLDLGSRNREQGTKTDVEFADAELVLVSPTARPVSVERLVFEAWQTSTGKTRAKLDDKRRRAIARALKAYPLEDVMAAVRGWQSDPWTERPRHNDLTVLLRDAAHIEKFRDLDRDGPQDLNARLDAWAAEDGAS